MAERSLLARLTFQAGVSPGGSCRVLATRTRPIAVNLPRDGDWELIPAWLGIDNPALARPGNWELLAHHLAEREPEPVVDRGREIGLALAGTGHAITPRHFFAPIHPANAAAPREDTPLVVDLSALWAGPLSSHLLWVCGAQVIKMESVSRPDGGREGNHAFYALLNQGKRCVALELRNKTGRERLKALLSAADIVIESSRPRALRQLGIVAEDLIAAKPWLTWISITGYGRSEPCGNWIAYGDDAGVAAGMADLMHEACGSYEFAGDAIADPLTGIDVALAAMHGWQSGGLGLVSIALADVMAWAIRHELEQSGREKLLGDLAGWWRDVREHGPAADRRTITDTVSTLGQDTTEVLTKLGIPC